MRNLILVCTVVAISFSYIAKLFAQASGTAWSKNVALLAKSDWGHGGAPNIWGWRDSQTGKDYALVTYVGTDGINIV